MATKFTADVTRDIPLATANPAAAAEAISLKGKALGQAIGFLGGTAYEAYKTFGNQPFEQKMGDVNEAFYGTEATKRIQQGEQLLAGAKLSSLTSLEVQGPESGAEKDAAVQELSDRLKTMKETYAQKRIGLGEFLTRQEALSREWIAKFPGRADEIRQEAARISGVKGIEDITRNTYLKDKFDQAEATGRQAAQAADEMRKQNLERATAIIKGGYLPGAINASQVANAIENKDPKALEAMDQMDTEVRIARERTALKDQIEVNRLTASEGGKVFTGNLIAWAVTGANEALIKTRAEFAPLVREISELRNNNNGGFSVVDVDTYRSKLAPFQAKATGVINAYYNDAYNQLSSNALVKQNSADFQARSKELEDSRKTLLEMVNSDDLGVVATMLESIGKVNKDTIASSMQIMQIYNEKLKTFGIAAPDLFMFLNTPEVFEKKYPAAYKELMLIAPGMKNSNDRMLAISGSAWLTDTSRNTQAAIANGTTLPVDAASRAVTIEKAIGLNPAAPLSASGGKPFPDRQQMVGALSVILSSIPKEGPKGPHIAYASFNFNNIKKSYETMSPEEKGFMQQAWNKSSERLTGDRSIEAVVQKEVDAVRERGYNVDLVIKDGRYNTMVTPKVKETTDRRDYTNLIYAVGIREQEMFLRSVTGYANAITDINNIFSDGKVSPTAVSTGGQQPAISKPPAPAPGVSLDVSSVATTDKFLRKLSLAESGNEPTAKATTSTATGLYQFTEDTWKGVVKQMGKDYTLEDRKDPTKSKEVAKFVTEQNAETLRKALGEEPDETDLYTAHFLGASTAVKFLKAKASTPVNQIVSPAAIEANKSIFLDKDGKPRSKASVQAFLVKKMS